MPCLYLLVDQKRQAKFQDHVEGDGDDTPEIGPTFSDTVQAVGTMLCQTCTEVGHATCKIYRTVGGGLQTMGQILTDGCENIRHQGIQDLGHEK